MKKRNILIKYLILIVVTLILLILNVSIGSVRIPFSDVFNSILGRIENVTYADIILEIRFPRSIGAFLVGGALALSGYALQTFFRNPIAGPYILGISSGAKLAVAILFVVGTGTFYISYFGMIFAGFIGAILSLGFVLVCSKRVNNMALLLVCGVMIGYICTAITDFIVTFANDADIVNLHNWSRGSLSGITWNNVVVMSITIIVFSIFMFAISKPMNAYIMGESYAKSLGVNTTLFRVALVVISSVLAATVTAFVGPVSFVGIAVPHLVRGLFKETKTRIIIPAAFLLGGAFCLLCDLIARVVFAPTELSISTVTAIFGAPIVIWMLVKNRMGR